MNALIKLLPESTKEQTGNEASAIGNLAVVLLILVLVAPCAGADLGLGFWSRDLTRAPRERSSLKAGPLGAIVVAVTRAAPPRPPAFCPSTAS